MRTVLWAFWLSGVGFCAETAPPLVLERTIPAGVQLVPDRPLVLEFWATWCGNCVAEIGHWNQLVPKFPGIQFYFVTDEPLSTVAPFLAKQPIPGVVALDRDGATFRAYGVDARPQTVLIDRSGKIRAVMHPAQVSEATLADLEAGREVKPAGLHQRLAMLGDSTADPVFAMLLRLSSNPKPGGTFGIDGGKLEGTNIYLRTILARAFGVGERLIEGPETYLNTRWDFCVLLPDGVPGDMELLRLMLERSFQLKMSRPLRMMDAIVLHASRPLSGPQRMSDLARLLEWRLQRPVVNATGSESYQHFQFPEKDEEVADAVRSRLGIELVYERRPVETLVIESIELPTFRMRPLAQR